MTRLFVAAATWLAAFGLFAALVLWSARTPRPTPTPPAVTALVKALNNLQPGRSASTREPWTVTRATSAHRAMVIDVEADQPEDSAAIAREIVAPLEKTYDEVLIYIRPTGNPVGALVRRIQWTPHQGWVESSY